MKATEGHISILAAEIAAHLDESKSAEPMAQLGQLLVSCQARQLDCSLKLAHVIFEIDLFRDAIEFFVRSASFGQLDRL